MHVISRVVSPWIGDGEHSHLYMKRRGTGERGRLKLIPAQERFFLGRLSSSLSSSA